MSITRLATEIREALGDDTTDDTKRFANQTLSATSLDVIRHYAAAMGAMSNGKFEDALRSYSKAVELDPKFGIGYQGMAVASRGLDRQQDAEKYIKQALEQVDGMTERERYRTRALYYGITGDFQNCVNEYGQLVAKYAADASARNNLAVCSNFLRDTKRAVDETREVLKILPKRPLYHINLALHAAYAGDFETAESEAHVAQTLGGAVGLQPSAWRNSDRGISARPSKRIRRWAKPTSSANRTWRPGWATWRSTKAGSRMLSESSSRAPPRTWPRRNRIRPPGSSPRWHTCSWPGARSVPPRMPPKPR